MPSQAALASAPSGGFQLQKPLRYGSGVTSKKKVHTDDVWARVLDQLGVEPRSAPTSSTRALTATTSMAASSDSYATGAKAKVAFLDLPLETQKEVFKHASTTDLIALALVSSHFRELAAERLYRSFHIVFPDEDVDGESPIDVLAAGLETLVTSDYEYAKHLHEIVLEPVSGGDKGESAYRYYMYEQSCGRFMNTLFLLVLRKAQCLDTFKWDIRVELSRPVFKALHHLDALQHLHIRMHPGHSTYQTPSAITTSSAIHVTNHPVSLPPPPFPPGFGHAPHNHALSSAHNIYTSSSSNSFGATASKHGSKSTAKDGKLLVPAIKKLPPTISGFKHLRTLEILDMDTLDYTGELRGCIRSSCSTLDTLKLSFSEVLANKARKPPPEIHSEDDSEVEDEFGQVIPTGPPPGLPPSSTLDGPTKVLKAQEEKKKQEEVLQKILSIPMARKQKSGKLETVDDIKQLEKAAEVELAKLRARGEDPRVRFIKNLGPVAKKLMTFVDPGTDNTADAKKVLEMIERAAKLYTESVEQPSKAPSEEGEIKGTASTSKTSVGQAGDGDVVMSGGAVEEPGLFDAPAKAKKVVEGEPGVANPDDIDIEEPEADDLLDELEEGENELQSDSPASAENRNSDEVINGSENSDSLNSQSPVISESPSLDQNGSADINKRQHLITQAALLRASHVQVQEEADQLKNKMEELREKAQNAGPTNINYLALAHAEAEFSKVSERVSELDRQMENLGLLADETGVVVPGRTATTNGVPAGKTTNGDTTPLSKSKNDMSEYLRLTRGLGIKTLAIYLVPVKANVLSRGLDLTVLRNITLLNVGPQSSIWTMLAKENAARPLPLEKVYTDNVTIPFLGFVAQLQNLTELLMTERQKPGRPETTANKTTVKIEQIRKALKKQVDNLKVLMIKHDMSSDWDVDIKTTMMLCQHAHNLEELSISFNAKVTHSFIQVIDELSSLRALHVNHFRQEDQCVWMKTNFLKFIVDIVSHNPSMKLEYIAIDQSVERLVRRTKAKPDKKSDKKATKSKSKGKGKVTDMKHLTEMVLGPGGSWPSGTNGSGATNSAVQFDWQASSDEESDPVALTGKSGLKLETVEGVHFTDVSDIRIFEKDVISGRL